MKIAVASSLVSAGIVSAGFNQIKFGIQSLVARDSSLWTDRSITAILNGFDTLINTYGCWCYFDENHGKGKGQPVNAIDEKCRQLAHAYDCAIMDAEDAGEPPCVPWDVQYIAGISQGKDSLIQQCEALNPSKCAADACKIEGDFVLTFFTDFVTINNQIDVSYQHANGWDPIEECKIGPEGEKDPNRQCCGEQPYRYKYKPFDGDRACCGQTVYSQTTQQCCPDNVPRISC